MLDRETFFAELMDGQSAAIHPVRVTVELGHLEVAYVDDGRLPFVWTLSGLRSEVLGGGVFHLRHVDAPGALLTTREAALAERAGAAAGKRPAPLRRSRARRLLLYGGGAAAALAAIYLALPGLSALVARRIPIGVEQTIGLQITPLLVKKRCQSPAVDQSLARLVDRLDRSRPTGFPIEIWVVDVDMVNAFALPGGRVVLTKGLLEKAEGPDEVAGIVAHEMAHVVERHVMTQVVRASLMSFFWATTIGDFSGLFVIDPSVALQIADRSFGRAQEHDADTGAVARLDAAGISRHGLAAFFERIQATTDVVPKILSTHPLSADRLRDINSGAPTGPTTPALSEADWKALKSACAPAAATPDP